MVGRSPVIRELSSLGAQVGNVVAKNSSPLIPYVFSWFEDKAF